MHEKPIIRPASGGMAVQRYWKQHPCDPTHDNYESVVSLAAEEDVVSFRQLKVRGVVSRIAEQCFTRCSYYCTIITSYKKFAVVHTELQYSCYNGI